MYVYSTASWIYNRPVNTLNTLYFEKDVPASAPSTPPAYYILRFYFTNSTTLEWLYNSQAERDDDYDMLLALNYGGGGGGAVTSVNGDTGDVIVNEDNNFEYVQAVPASTWLIDHTLNKYPSVTVIDSANTIVIGEVTYNSDTQLVITFQSAFTGKAILN